MQRPPAIRLLDIVAVFAGGALGTSLRYGLTLLLPTEGALPVTFAINVTGAFALGALNEWVRGPADRWRARSISTFFGTGVLGGYTTYGMFAVDADGLLDTSRVGDSILYGLATVVLGVAAAYGGTRAAGALRRGRSDERRKQERPAARERSPR
ncbi:CrcB family protein [Herbiconiux sp. 11R-BC]|uniref:fluoride efflux transporter FluC n=1 Tax=Herbiconiux sp. 11R-BC TaxID=3111637 RepID=UPI003C0FCBD6